MIHEKFGGLGHSRITLVEIRVEQVEGGDIQGRRNLHPAVTIDQHLGKVDTRPAVVGASVDMRRLDVYEILGAIGLANGYQQLHGDPPGIAHFAGK
jgi:hypothetical protein